MSEEYEGYKIEADGTYSMKVIKAIGKGSVHLDLRGLYSSVGEARLAIDSFINRKGKGNAKATKSS